MQHPVIKPSAIKSQQEHLMLAEAYSKNLGWNNTILTFFFFFFKKTIVLCLIHKLAKTKVNLFVLGQHKKGDSVYCILFGLNNPKSKHLTENVSHSWLWRIKWSLPHLSEDYDVMCALIIPCPHFPPINNLQRN